MRPARKGPENSFPGRGCGRTRTRFNEAGPQGTGKSRRPDRRWATRRGFNEAGPQGTGKLVVMTFTLSVAGLLQ